MSNYVNKRKRSFEIQDNRIVSLLKLTVLKPQRPNLQLWKAVLICQLMRESNGGHGLGKIAEKPPRDLRLSHGDKCNHRSPSKMAIFRDTEAQFTAMESCAHLPADERVKWRPWPRENRRKTSAGPPPKSWGQVQPQKPF